MTKTFVKIVCLWEVLSRDEETRDRLVQDYGTMLRESAVLTALAGILFGFLFEASTSAPGSLAFALVAVPFVMVYIFFRLRK